ncbi:MAG: arylsulfatase [Opitutales bacterium]
MPRNAIALILVAVACSLRAASAPNIIFILTDDQGYGDLSAHGNPVLKTPNVDRLRSESVRFEDFHVSPTCSPTRSALMTGRHEFKNGVTHTILERERMTLKAPTYPQLLQKAGYRTGVFGKWHLGDEAEYQPGRRGFDEVYIHGAGGIGQSYPGSCGDAPGNTYYGPWILHNGKFEKTEAYCTDAFFGQATRWIEGEVAAKRRFFAYIPTNAPHGPYHARPEDAALYEGKGLGKDVENFFGMIHNIDQNVGRLLARLDALGIAENTLVVYMNDNGGTAGTRVYNAGMRASKGSPFLGGTRAMSLWRWKGRFAPAEVKQLTAHIDVFRTFTGLAGVEIPAEVQPQVEGRSLLPLLEGGNVEWPDRTLFTHVGRWGNMNKGVDPESGRLQQTSVRTNRWHLVSSTPGLGLPAAKAGAPKAAQKGAGKAAKGRSAPGQMVWMLFDVTKDYGETHDVAAEHPEVVKDLIARHEAWWKECRPLMVNEDVQGPAENPFKVLFRQQIGR